MISDQGQKSEWASILPAAMFAAPTAGLWFFSWNLTLLSWAAFSSMPQAAEPTGVETALPSRSEILYISDFTGTTMALPEPLRL